MPLQSLTQLINVTISNWKKEKREERREGRTANATTWIYSEGPADALALAAVILN